MTGQAADSVTFHVPGPPVPKGRPRVGTNGKRPVVYTDQRTRDWEQLVALHCRSQAARKGVPVPIRGPVAVVLVFHLERKGNLSEYPDGDKSDIDNLAKAVLDGVQTSGVIGNDRQVVDLHACERWADSVGAGVTVTILRPDTWPRIWAIT